MEDRVASEQFEQQKGDENGSSKSQNVYKNSYSTQGVEKLYKSKSSKEAKRATTENRSTGEQFYVVTMKEDEIPKNVIDLESPSHGLAKGNMRGKNHPKDGTITFIKERYGKGRTWKQ